MCTTITDITELRRKAIQETNIILTFYTARVVGSLGDELINKTEFEAFVTYLETVQTQGDESLAVLCGKVVGKINQLDTKTRGKFLAQSHELELKLETDPDVDSMYLKTFTNRFNANWNALVTYYREYADGDENKLKTPIFGVLTKIDLLTVLTEWKDREIQRLTPEMSYELVLSTLSNLTKDYLGYISEQYTATDYPKVCNYF